MSEFARDVSVSCPAEHVFKVLANVERLPEFSHLTTAVRNGPDRPVRVGDHFEQAVKVLGVEFDTEWEVTDFVPDNLIRFQGHSEHNGRATMTQRISPEGDVCRVTFEVDYDPPFGILGVIADKVVFERRNEADAERILAQLKDLCERVAVP